MTQEPVSRNLLPGISVIVPALARQQASRQTGPGKENFVSRRLSHASGCVKAVIGICRQVERSEIPQLVIARPDSDYVVTRASFARGGVREELTNA